MSIQEELKLPHPFNNKSHEAMINIVVTGTLLLREGATFLRPFGLTDAQFNILMLLKYQSENGKINQTRLGSMLLIHRSNITGIIDRMEKSDLVRRIADPEDRRVNYVEMTERGKNILEEAHKVYYKRLDEVMSVLSGYDYTQINTLLEKIRKKLLNANPSV